MAVVTTNLGVITAYGDAVAAGYTGTKAQWQALMADYATVGQQAAQSAQTASTAATTATTAAQTATTKASEASASATAAEQAAASISTPDTTLTQSGKAADAKATGDKISEIKEDFNDIDRELNGRYSLPLEWEQGNLNYSGEVSNSKVIRTGYFSTTDVQKITASVETGFVASICKYSGNTNPASQLLGYIELTSGTHEVIPDGTYSYIRFKMQKTESVAIVPTEGVNLSAAYHYDGSLKSDFNNMVNSVYVTDSASGSVAHFVDGADDVPMKSVKVLLEPIQSGSGDASPSNVRPISGHSRTVKVTRSGKNLLKNSASSTTMKGVTFTVNDDGSVTVNGTNNSTTTISFHLGVRTFFALPEGRYTLSGCPSGGGATSYFLSLYHHGAGANNFGKFDFGSGQTYELTTENNTGLGVRIGVISGQTVDNLTFYPMLRLASDSDDAYESYNGNTYNINLSSAGTVYGGTLDVVSGTLTVDKKIVTIDGSTVPFTFASSNNTNAEYKNAIFGIASVDALQSASASAVPDMIADKATAISYNAAASKTAENYGVTITDVGIVTTTRVRVSIPKSQNVITVADANTWAGSNPITVVYPITNPLTYQLTATEIKSLLGINNVWSDAGDIDVEYRADTKLYIDKRLGV